VAPGPGEELVGVKVIGCSGQDGGSWHVWRRGSGWSVTEGCLTALSSIKEAKTGNLWLRYQLFLAKE
jgi:hypothetical protein